MGDSDSYLGSTYKCLYAATTGSTKYDKRSNYSQQMWILQKKQKPTEFTDFKYGETVQLMDTHFYSYMAVNLTASAASYGAPGKVWIEAKLPWHMLKNFCNNLIFERA